MLGPLEDALADPIEPLPSNQIERLTMVRRNGLRLQKLVNALLDFSRVEAGRIQANYQLTDLASFTRDLAASFQAACEKAGLRLSIDTPSLPQPVFVDPDMWEKIVLNLVSNAFKFTHQGGIYLEIRGEDGYAVLRVRDTGVGIPEAELPQIFNRFHRVEGAGGRAHEGTGIGLALVRELVKLHSGALSAKSVLGRGTTFTVRIPFGSEHLPQERLARTSTLVSTATRADVFVAEALRWLPDTLSPGPVEHQFEWDAMRPGPDPDRPRVLLADDNSDMREYLSRLLSPAYAVTAVSNGADALADARVPI